MYLLFLSDDPPSVVLTSELTQRDVNIRSGDVKTKIISKDTDFWVLYVTDTLNKDGKNLMATGYHWFSLPENTKVCFMTRKLFQSSL